MGIPDPQPRCTARGYAKRRDTRLALASLVLCIAPLVGACGGDRAQPPNVLLISIDTLRPDRLGCYGHDRPTSPALDAFAARGVRFGDASTTSPWTLPSHASLLTGRYPSRHGVMDQVHRLPEDATTLAGLLAARGYATRAVVNSFYLSTRFGLDRGFQDYDYVSEWAEPGEGGRRTVNAGGEITDRGIGWLAEERDRPFLLFLHYYDVHSDFSPRAEFRAELVRPYRGTLDGTTAQLIQLRRSGTALRPNDVRHLFDLYDAEIRQLDVELGRLFAFLDETGLAENTVVVVTSDHGEEFQEHGSLLHGRTQYQELVAVPLLVRGPGVPAGIVVDDPVSIVDIAPTILGLVGARFDGADGHDLAGLMRGDGRSPGRELFSEADHNNAEPDMLQMIRVDGDKLVYDRLAQRARLFDLRLDPGEAQDLAETRPDRAVELLERLHRFRAGAVHPEEIAPLGEEELERLRALGYQ